MSNSNLNSKSKQLRFAIVNVEGHNSFYYPCDVIDNAEDVKTLENEIASILNFRSETVSIKQIVYLIIEEVQIEYPEPESEDEDDFMFEDEPGPEDEDIDEDELEEEKGSTEEKYEACHPNIVEVEANANEHIGYPSIEEVEAETSRKELSGDRQWYFKGVI